LQVLGAILVDGSNETPNGSIARLNIFTHANEDLIAFAGTVRPLNVGSSVSLEVDTAFSEDTLDKINQRGVPFYVNSKKFAKKAFTMDDVRRRFAKDAVIVIYACHSGLDSRFIQYLADTFQVRVRGFKSVIGYFPSYSEQPLSVNRRRLGIGYNAKVVVTDFHELDKSADAVNLSPKAPSESE
jgi:hypothetical protein